MATEPTMAIMRNVRFGVGDRDVCWLQFETKLAGGSAAMQYLMPDEAIPLIEEYGVRDVHDLNGKPCLVDTSEQGRILFVGACKV